MVTTFLPSFFAVRSHRKPSDFVLSFLWLFGFVIGLALSYPGIHSFSLWMRAAEFGSVSIVWLYISLFLPFLFSAIAVFFRLNWLVYVIAFCKAFFFGFCVSGILFTCRSAGWLVCLLLFFSDFSLLPWLYFFMRRCLNRISFLRAELTSFAAFVFLVVSIDRCVISPFLASLI